jgi:hypothetical protein
MFFSFVWSFWFVWLNETNETHETNQRNQIACWLKDPIKTYNSSHAPRR